MKSTAEATVLDVAHGNATLIRSGDSVIVLDAPQREHVVDALRRDGVSEVRIALASHSDADHCAGLIGLLLDPTIVVNEVRLNADAVKESKFWESLKVAYRWANANHGTTMHLGLTSDTADIELGGVRLQVLAPDPVLALGGVGSTSPTGAVVSANAMSVVVRVSLDGDDVMLLPGDVGVGGLEFLLRNGAPATARVLVFPHHGGMPEGASGVEAIEDFVRRFIGLVQPETIVFSIGRGARPFPREEIVRLIRNEFPEVRIACTQLSTSCAEDPIDQSHLGTRYSAGRGRGTCCAGTLTFRPGGDPVEPSLADHATAVSVLASRLCR